MTETRYDLWVDYHRRDADGLTHAHVDDVESGRALVPGSFVIVGNAERTRPSPRLSPSTTTASYSSAWT